jgi:hypothetical protein
MADNRSGADGGCASCYRKAVEPELKPMGDRG